MAFLGRFKQRHLSTLIGFAEEAFNSLRRKRSILRLIHVTAEGVLKIPHHGLGSVTQVVGGAGLVVDHLRYTFLVAVVTAGALHSVVVVAHVSCGVVVVVVVV